MREFHKDDIDEIIDKFRKGMSITRLSATFTCSEEAIETKIREWMLAQEKSRERND